jgi:hypothetical protein
MSNLVTAYGDRGRLVEGLLPDPLFDLLAVFDIDATPAPAAVTSAAETRMAEVTAKADAWVAELGNMQSVNILTALIEAAGFDDEAFTLRHWVWRYYRRGEDADGPSYWRYQHRFGHQLLERGVLGHDVDATPKMDGSITFRVGWGDLKLKPEDNAWQFLFRAWNQGHRPIAWVEMALIVGLTRDVTTARNTIRLVRSKEEEVKDHLTFVDAVIVGAWIHEMAGNFSDGLEWVDRALRLVQAYGDEPRRAALCAHRARFLVRVGRTAEAHEPLRDGLAIAGRLALRVATADLEMSAGILALAESDFVRGKDLLGRAWGGYFNQQHEPRRVFCQIERTRAVCLAGDPQTAIRESVDLLDKYRGYGPHFFLASAEVFARTGNFTVARQHLQHAVDYGEVTANEWVHSEAQRLGELFDEFEARRTQG